MRWLMAIAFTAAFGVSAPAETVQNDYAQRLDKLFAALHNAPDDAAAKLAEIQIWAIWANDDTPDAVSLLAEASAAMNSGAFDLAEQKLIALVQAHPNFAEGWNRRATLYFMQGRYDESLADIAKVLELEPRHFGALSGKGMVLRAQHKPAEALKAMKDALAINPNLSGLKDSVEQMEKLQPEL
ncbi:MAG: tetratricopeptide repeat protein [Aestuariivirga sp.]